MSDHPGPHPFPTPEPQPAPTIPAAPTTPKRRTGLIATGTGILGLVAGLAIGSSGTNPATPAPAAAPTATVTSAAPTTTPTPQPEPTTPEPTPDPTTTVAEAAPEGGDGTRKNPFAIGQKVGNDDWDITLGAPKESWKAIKAANQFNDPAPKGMEYYIVPVDATYLGDETGLAWTDLTVRFVGDDGVTYSDYCGVLPDALNDVGELYEGGRAKGNVCVAVPAGAKGLWTLSVGWGDPVFFTAKK